MIRRRDFIAALGGAAAWPLAARGQQGERMRRIGVLIPDDENDPVFKPYIPAFTQALAGLGWTDGRNLRMDLRWVDFDINRIRALAQELVGLQPDIIVTSSRPLPSSGRRGRSRSSLRTQPSPSPAASSRDSTNRAGTSPASPSSKPRWEASGLSCSRRSRPAATGPQPCLIPAKLPYWLICPHLRRRPGHSRSC